MLRMRRKQPDMIATPKDLAPSVSTPPPLPSELETLHTRRQEAQARVAAFNDEGNRLTGEQRRTEKELQTQQHILDAGDSTQVNQASLQIAGLTSAVALFSERMQLLADSAEATRREIFLVIDRDIAEAKTRAELLRGSIQHRQSRIQREETHLAELEHAAVLTRQRIATERAQVSTLEQQLTAVVGRAG